MQKRIVACLLAVLLCLTGVAAAVSAVERVQSLGIMQGLPDGSFQSSGSVTRAQMARIIFVMTKSSSDTTDYSKLTTSFTDITNHWASAEIKYCMVRGYVKGRSATTFAPNEQVTTREAAKMLLVSKLGRDNNKDGLSGINWASNTDALARQYGLYSGVGALAGSVINRGEVAQMICNALDAE